MTPRIYGGAFRVTSLGCLTTLWLTGGCASTAFGPAVARYADNAAVTNAAARHTTASPYYRFNSELLSDLDDAIQSTDEQTQRELAAAVLRRANALSRASTANEIERMPTRDREALKREMRSGGSDGPTTPATASPSSSTLVLASTGTGPAEATLPGQHFSALATEVLENDLREVDQLPRQDVVNKLRRLREGVENLPDDRGRWQRQVLFAWAAPLTAIGMAMEESKLSEKSLAKAEKKFNRVAIWRPTADADHTLIEKFAPILGVEWPEQRPYDADWDRIGEVTLSEAGGRTDVHVEPAEPRVYAFIGEAKIGGQRLRQVNYVWWYPEHPAMEKNDPSAGHIDGAMLRITLNTRDEPIFVESSLNCGCSHEVFVSAAVESAARRVYGAPLAGKRFAVEAHLRDTRDGVVIHLFDLTSHSTHPLVLSAVGYHEVDQISFNPTESISGMDIAEERSYRLLDYDTLDRLPLGDGVASMFGPDGLVLHAARPEGILLAPSGILSAGQPRKRGTQRVRWDDYLEDDPHLLETILRIPPLD